LTQTHVRVILETEQMFGGDFMYMNKQLFERSSAIPSPQHPVFRLGANKRLVRIAGLLIAAVVILIFSLSISLLGGDQDAFAATGDVSMEHTYEIVQGDNLWNIANNQVHKGQDIRAYINEIKKLNGLKSSILQEGQVIQLP
jgi:hypothetical protein